MEGKLEGRIKVARRRRKQLPDDLTKERTL